MNWILKYTFYACVCWQKCNNVVLVDVKFENSDLDYELLKLSNTIAQPSLLLTFMKN
jgi:hypothetical protein